jgi:hypothetical protein
MLTYCSWKEKEVTCTIRTSMVQKENNVVVLGRREVYFMQRNKGFVVARAGFL